MVWQPIGVSKIAVAAAKSQFSCGPHCPSFLGRRSFLLQTQWRFFCCLLLFCFLVCIFFPRIIRWRVDRFSLTCIFRLSAFWRVLLAHNFFQSDSSYSECAFFRVRVQCRICTPPFFSCYKLRVFPFLCSLHSWDHDRWPGSWKVRCHLRAAFGSQENETRMICKRTERES